MHSISFLPACLHPWRRQIHLYPCLHMHPGHHPGHLQCHPRHQPAKVVRQWQVCYWWSGKVRQVNVHVSTFFDYVVLMYHLKGQLNASTSYSAHPLSTTALLPACLHPWQRSLHLCPCLQCHSGHHLQCHPCYQPVKMSRQQECGCSCVFRITFAALMYLSVRKKLDSISHLHI